ncbi:putative anti-restriction protein, partial [Escherichia coli P0302308.2]
ASRVRQAAASLAPCASPPYRPAFMEARHRPVPQNM